MLRPESDRLCFPLSEAKVEPTGVILRGRCVFFLTAFGEPLPGRRLVRGARETRHVVGRHVLEGAVRTEFARSPVPLVPLETQRHCRDRDKVQKT